MPSLTVRNIPDEEYAVLEEIAKKEHRSMSSQIKFMIRELAGRNGDKKRMYEISARLKVLFKLLNERHQPNLYPVNVSRMAQAIGLEYVIPVEKWLSATEEPSIQQLEEIAMQYGVNQRWLVHGLGSIYHTGKVDLPPDPKDAVEWLKSTPQKDNKEHSKEFNEEYDFKGERVYKVSFVREKSEDGGLLIVKHTKSIDPENKISGSYAIYKTGYHVSENIGATGEANLIKLFKTLKELDATHNKGENHIDVCSYLITRQDFDRLSSGFACPDEVLRQGHSLWWEDVWDKNMEREYWDGCIELCKRIRKNLG